MKERAPRNRTLSCDEQEIARLSKSLKRLTEPVSAEDVQGAVVNQDLFEAAAFLPRSFADLILILGDHPKPASGDHLKTGHFG